MLLTDTIKQRNEQLDLLSAFVHKDPLFSPRSMLIYGNESAGKSYTVKGYLDYHTIKYSWIQCDECIAFKILLKRILQAVQVDSGLRQKDEVILDSDSYSSFDGFIAELQEVFSTEDSKEQHYIVLDRADMLNEEGEDLFGKFVKFHEASYIQNISIIFITCTQPRKLITAALPTIFFEAYDSTQITRILEEKPLCKFSRQISLPPAANKRFWENYVGIIVESYFSYTTNINVLRRIALKLWSRFTEVVENGNLQASEFLAIYRQNIGLLSSDYAFETSLKSTSTGNKNVERDIYNTSFPIMSKYIIIASYLASFNESKYDWVFFSKLKDFHKKKQHFRQSKLSATRLNSRLLEPSPFDLERLLAILHSIYTLENTKPLPSNLDINTQIANLSSLKILLKSSNIDYISAKTRWKVNVNFSYVKAIAEDLEFPLETYLAE